MQSSTATAPHFEGFRVAIEGAVGWLWFNRPKVANAIDLKGWDELPAAVNWLAAQTGVRSIVLAGEGRHFCAGIALEILDQLLGYTASADRATRGREQVLAFIEKAQQAISAVEKCPVPVIAAIHGACVGGAVDLIAACDLRLASGDARFCIKEIDLAVVPDVGTLQRLTHVIGYAQTAELSYGAETFDAPRALALGLVSRVLDDKEALLQAATALAAAIASKSPATVRGIKRNLVFARDHSVPDGLAYTAAWNAGMLTGEDLAEALAAFKAKRAAVFVD